MNITEFAQSRCVEPQAVSRYVSRHRGLKNLTYKDGKNVVLTDAAIEILNHKYPLPKPIEVVEDTESRRALIEAQKMIISLQQQLAEQQKLIGETVLQRQLIEAKDNRIAELETKLHAAEDLNQRANTATLWQRIRRKW